MKLGYSEIFAVKYLVAPRRGAWIETVIGIFQIVSLRPSHPAGVRGLKLKNS